MCFCSVIGIIFEHVAILFDESAAAAGGLHNGFGALFNVRPPGINIGAHASTPVVLGVEVEINGAAAACFSHWRYANAKPVKNPRGGSIGIG